MATVDVSSGSNRQLLVLNAIDRLHGLLTQRYKGYAVNDIMLRSVMESVCPLAPREAKDYALRRLRQDFGGQMEKDTFKHILCNVMAADRSISAFEVLGRVESENSRLEKAIEFEERNRAEGAEGEPFLLPSRAAERIVTQERTIRNMERSLEEMERRYRELVATSDANSDPMSATRAILDARRHAEENVEQEDNFEKEPPLRPPTADPADLAQITLSVPSASATPTRQLIVDGQAVDVLTDPTPQQQTAGYAILMAETRARQAEQRLMEANAKLERFGFFYDRRGDVIHNTRIIADAAYNAKKTQLQFEQQMDAHRERVIAANSTITSPYIRPPPPNQLGMASSSPGNRQRSQSSFGSSSVGEHSMSYDSVLGPASFALRSERRDTDTILSAPLPIAFEDASRILMGNRSPPMSAPQFSPAYQSPPPSSRGLGYKSRMDGMYHLLNLEKGETNRWRHSAGSAL